MIELAEARRRAEARLAAIEAEIALTLVFTAEREFVEGWAFSYDSARHQETGQIGDGLAGNAPIFVDRETGNILPTGTAHPIEYYADAFAERKRRLREGWPQGLDGRLYELLRLVRDGAGRRDARTLDMYISTKHEPRPRHHVRDELLELEHRGLVHRLPDSNGGVGNRWAITAEGLEALESESA